MDLFQSKNTSVINLPNALSITRLFGTPFLFWLVTFDNLTWFIFTYLFLGFTDFLDGKLARLWNQATDLGAHLDSAADVLFYLSTAWFLYYLFPEFVHPNLLFLYIFLGIMIISVIISLSLFRKILFFHTHLSKSAGVVVFFTMAASFYTDTTWLIGLCIFIYTLAFFEFIMIYFLRGDVSPDTRSVFNRKTTTLK